MPGIVGQGTTFNLPNFVGDLFTISPEETPFLTAIGGLTGGRPAYDKSFGWEFYDLRDADPDRQRVEGADAPVPAERVRQSADNVVEIHQEAVEVSYTRQAVAARGGFATTLRGSSGVTNEEDWQVDMALRQIARDIEVSFILGTYQNPTDNTTPRKTRGILEAITSNVIDLNGGTPTIEDINDLFQLGYDNGGFAEGDTRVLMVGSGAKRLLTKLFVTDPGLVPASRNVGGANLIAVETDFGTAGIMVNRYVPADTIIALSLEEIAPRFLSVPGKGFLFVEPLAKTGAADRSQIYGEIGLEYGNQLKHAKMVDIVTGYEPAGSGS